MTWFTKWAFSNKAAVTVLVLITLVVGILSYVTLPMEFMPEADNPQVTVTVLGQGHDAKSMEELVTTPIEKALSNVKGKTDIFSQSGDGFSQVNVFYDGETDMKLAKQEVNEAVASVPLPANVMKPYVLQLNTSMIPVSEISVSFADGFTEENIKHIEETIIPELQKVDGVANVMLYGLASPTVNITPKMDALIERGIPVQALMGVLQGRNLSAAVSESIIDGQLSSIKVESTIESLDDLKNLEIAPQTKLGDVADVTQAVAQESITRIDGKDVLYMSVTKEANANIASVGEGIEERVDDLNEKYDNAEVSVFFTTSDMVVNSVNKMIREVLLGALFATIVIMLFLRNLKATFITIVSIPLSLGLTLYLLSLFGITLNILTLGGVAVAVGRLVDDSIVVIENIYRRSQKEKFSVDLIVDSTREVARAITASTLVTVAVFLPMGLLSGSLQAFVRPFALTVTFSLLASLLVSLTVVPLMSFGLLRNAKIKEHQESKRYVSFLTWNLNHKWVSLVLASVLFLGSIATYFMMPKAAMDASDSSMVNIDLAYPADTPLEEVIDNGYRLEQFLIEQPQAETVLMQNGNSSDAAQWGSVVSPTLVMYTVMMKEGADAETFIENVKAQQAQYPNAQLEANGGSLLGSSSSEVTIDITGNEDTELPRLAQEVVDAISPIEGVLKVSSNLDEKKPVYAFNVNPSAANAQDIAIQLNSMLNPMPIGSIHLQEGMANVLLAPLASVSNPQQLNELTIQTANGPVPISSVAELEQRIESTSSYHKDGKPYVRITAAVDPAELSVVAMDIEEATKDIEMPKNYELIMGGAQADLSGDMNQLFMTALVSIFIVFVIMVMTFKSIRAPIAIILTLPLAAIGAVLGLIVSQVSPDMTAALGALMLVGIVVTNAIVLIDKVKQNEETMIIREAVVEAAATRIRPIFMTAIATICAMLPLVFGKSEEMSLVSQSLAIVVIGGLAVATLLTLIVIPVVYELFHFRKSRKQRNQAKADAAVAQ